MYQKIFNRSDNDLKANIFTLDEWKYFFPNAKNNSLSNTQGALKEAGVVSKMNMLC